MSGARFSRIAQLASTRLRRGSDTSRAYVEPVDRRTSVRFRVSSGPGARSALTRVAARPREREPGALAGCADQAGSKHPDDSRNRGKGGQPVWPITTPDRRGRGDARRWCRVGRAAPHRVRPAFVQASRWRTLQQDQRSVLASSVRGFSRRSGSGIRRQHRRGMAVSPAPSLMAAFRAGGRLR